MSRQPIIKNLIRPPAPNLQTRIWFGISLLLPAFVFFPVIGYDFVFWDDDINLFNNPNMVVPLDFAWLAWAFTDGDSALRYKPLNWLVWKLWIEWVGFDPWGFHLLSLLFHALNAGLLFVLLHLVLKSLDGRGAALQLRHNLPAAAAAILWGVHPMRVEAVAWITGFPYLLSSTFLLLAIICFLRAGGSPSPNRLLGTSAVFLTLSFLSYPLALLFPAVILLWDLWQNNRPRWQRLHLSAARWTYHASTFFAASAILGYNLIINFRGSDVIDFDPASNPVSEPLRWVRGIYGIASYLGRWVYPADLAPVYFNHHFFTLNPWPEAAACLLLLVGLAGITYLGMKHHFAWIIGAAAYLALTIPTGGFLAENITFADRYAYQGHMVIAAAFAVAILVFLNRGKTVAIVLKCVILPLLIALSGTSFLVSRQQLAVWQDTESLMLYVEPMTRPYPGIESMMLVRRGLALASEKSVARALTLLRQATEIAPGNWAAWYYRGFVALSNNRPEEALSSFNRAQELQFDPQLETLRLRLIPSDQDN